LLPPTTTGPADTSGSPGELLEPLPDVVGVDDDGRGERSEGGGEGDDADLRLAKWIATCIVADP
jgi:hypothetical protein